MKVALFTFGCKLNFSETSTISRSFTENGFNVVDFNSKADVYIINSCSVTENADKECKKIVKKIKTKNPKSIIGIIGCYAQLKPKEISKTMEENDKIEIKPSQIDLGKEINKIGSYEAKINLHAEIQAKIHIEVVKEETKT